MSKTNALLPNSLAIIAIMAFTASGCRQSEDSRPRPTAANTNLPMPASSPSRGPASAEHLGQDSSKEKDASDTAEELKALGSAESESALENHRLLVMPPDPGFVPRRDARKVELRLSLATGRIRVGERARFRLEMKNVGDKTIEYSETAPSIFKFGGLGYSYRTISFFILKRGGKREKLRGTRVDTSLTDPGFRNAVPGGPPASLTASEKTRWVIETNARSQTQSHFKVTLAPGETLFTLGDMDSPNERYRTLFVSGLSENPGHYRIQVRLDDRPEPLTQESIREDSAFSTPAETRRFHERRLNESLGPVDSNIVELEVVP